MRRRSTNSNDSSSKYSKGLWGPRSAMVCISMEDITGD
jgi:hypothetical protein